MTCGAQLKTCEETFEACERQVCAAMTAGSKKRESCNSDVKLHSQLLGLACDRVIGGFQSDLIECVYNAIFELLFSAKPAHSVKQCIGGGVVS